MLLIKPDISVVIATYNGERFLQQQLESILSQTIPPCEIVVVDDASSDGTVAMLNAYAAGDPRFRILINEENIGYIKSFERGIVEANSILIALSDQDDVWMPHKLETLFARMHDYIAVYSDSILIDEKGRSTGQKMSDIKNQLTYNNCLMYTIGAWAPGHAMMFRKELVVKSQPFPAIVTHDFWLGYVAACNGGIGYINEVLVQYRQHTTNAIGANTLRNRKPSAIDRIKTAQQRMQLLFEKCPATLTEQKQVLQILSTTYQKTDLISRWKRMVTFLKYRDIILAYKKKSALMRILFCLKMFFKIDT